MDPLSVIGAVASVVQLAQSALSLSKTLYTLGSALGSASEDIHMLADDLKTFSQSLSLLSRLLEDSKAWYSDDIYLLTAKIIKDCAELYVKIDKILVKLGSNGKSTWKLRVKFVYKETQIQKLLSRLRDMKGTLATILMSLQVDLQLSLLNISSSSRIQRPPERPLQPETLRILLEAQQSITAKGILTKYAIQSETAPNVSGEEMSISIIQSERSRAGLTDPFSILSTNATFNMKRTQSDSKPSSSDKSLPTQSFVVLPPNANEFPLPTTRDRSSVPTQTASAGLPTLASTENNRISRNEESNSLKSSSSTDSFKSAISIQGHDLEVARKVKAVQSAMHAFETSIQTLQGLMQKRIKSDTSLLPAANGLQEILCEAKKRIDRKHVHLYKDLGEAYLSSFDPKWSSRVQLLSSYLLKKVVMKLHEYSAEHEELHARQLNKLCEISAGIALDFEDCLGRVAELAKQQISSCQAEIAGPTVPLTAEVLRRQQRREAGSSRDSEGTASQDESHYSRSATIRPTSNGTGAVEDEGIRHNLPAPPSKPSPPPTSLPFIGYTFKRFDDFNTGRSLNSIKDDQALKPTHGELPVTHSLSGVGEKIVQGTTAELLAAQYNTPKPAMPLSASSTSRKEIATERFRQRLAQKSAVRAAHKPGYIKEGLGASLPTSASSSAHAGSPSDQGQDAATERTPLQIYQEQLLSAVPGYAPNPNPLSVLQPIALPPAQIQQRKQNERDYRLSIMPNHDPDSQESKDAHSRALQDYQMSLMMGDCGKHNTPRRQMMRANSNDLTMASTFNSSVAPIAGPACMVQDFDFDSFLHDHTSSQPFVKSNFSYDPSDDSHNMLDGGTGDVLADFDFDSFLRDSSPTGEPFIFDDQNIAHGIRASNKASGSNVAERNDQSKADMDSLLSKLRAAAPQGADQRDPRSKPHSEDGEVDVQYINSKQFHRILKRRAARQQIAKSLEQQRKAQDHVAGTSEHARPTADSTDSTHPAETDDAPPLPIDQLDGRYQHPDTSIEHDKDNHIELAWSYPALSPTQTSRLWWQAYISLTSSSSSSTTSPIFTKISNALQSELGVVPSNCVFDEMICKRVSIRIANLGAVTHEDRPELINVLETRSSILKVLTTIEEQLGLEIATLGWSCVIVLLLRYEKIIKLTAQTSALVAYLEASLSQLQTVVGIIARYAVMENLYQQSGGALSLKLEYRMALISLCSSTLEYFATAIENADSEIGDLENERGDIELSEKSRREVDLAVQRDRERDVDKCAFLVEIIKQKDAASGGFRVVVETTKEPSSDDSDMEVEIISDEDWERIERDDIEKVTGVASNPIQEMADYI